MNKRKFNYTECNVARNSRIIETLDLHLTLVTGNSDFQMVRVYHINYYSQLVNLFEDNVRDVNVPG